MLFAQIYVRASVYFILQCCRSLCGKMLQIYHLELQSHSDSNYISLQCKICIHQLDTIKSYRNFVLLFSVAVSNFHLIQSDGIKSQSREIWFCDLIFKTAVKQFSTHEDLITDPYCGVCATSALESKTASTAFYVLSLCVEFFEPFNANVPFLYPIKTF